MTAANQVAAGLLAAGVAWMTSPGAAPAADLNKVNDALARGGGFLKQMYGPNGTGTRGQYGLGATALSGLAMLEAKVKPDVLYCHDGNVLTGAGSAAGIDASLHLLRDEYGAGVAAAVARRIVVPPHRDGGQAQYIARPVPVCESEALAPLLAWISANLAEELDVETLARQVHMSARTFARRFKEETGTTPYNWILGERVRAAQELLEQTDHSIDWVAAEVGFGNAATLRHHFGRSRGVSPQEYRRTFRTPA